MSNITMCDIIASASWEDHSFAPYVSMNDNNLLLLLL